ncbi:hypothetical protein [Bradyrhizobium sp. AZCC 1693]|uniref:hypothetical protein n=1 Tax=Bradyrhizobium sp. AZCC 1693 TaxID=3117029 RepID=UPI002FF42ACA
MGREAAQLSLHSSPELAKTVVPKLAEGSAAITESRWFTPGVNVFREGDWYVKTVDPAAGFFRRQWGRLSIESQAQGLSKLGDIGVDFTMREGALWTRSAGETMSKANGLFWQRYAQGSWRMGTLLNDLRLRNIGAGGMIFDPAWDPFVKSLIHGEIYGAKALTERLWNPKD